MRTLSRGAIGVCVLIVGTLSARARAGELRDEGNFFSPDAQQQARQLIDRVRINSGRDVVVHTYASIPADMRSGYSETKKVNFFDQWMIRLGRETGADVFVLITRDPSHVQVGSSQAMRNAGGFTVADQGETAGRILNRFRQRQFDQGLLEGLEFIDRRLAQTASAGRSGGAAGTTAGGGSRAGGPSGSGYPPPPGSGSSGQTRTPGPAVPQVRTCGMGSMVCLLIAVVGVVLLVRGIFGRRSGYGGGYGQPGYGQNVPPPAGGGYGYGQPGYGSPGGGFGRGVMGGVLGGLLGGWLFNRGAQAGGGAFGSGPDAGPAPLPPTDPSTFDTGGGGFSSTGGDFGGGSDLGGGGGIDVSDSGSSSGGDF